MIINRCRNFYEGGCADPPRRIMCHWQPQGSVAYWNIEKSPTYIHLYVFIIFSFNTIFEKHDFCGMCEIQGGPSFARITTVRCKIKQKQIFLTVTLFICSWMCCTAETRLCPTNVAIDAVNVFAKILNRQRQHQRHHRPTASKCGFAFRVPTSLPTVRSSLALPLILQTPTRYRSLHKRCYCCRHNFLYARH